MSWKFYESDSELAKLRQAYSHQVGYTSRRITTSAGTSHSFLHWLTHFFDPSLPSTRPTPANESGHTPRPH